MEEYLESFLIAAASAALPGTDKVNETEDDAKVSTTLSLLLLFSIIIIIIITIIIIIISK